MPMLAVMGPEKWPCNLPVRPGGQRQSLLRSGGINREIVASYRTDAGGFADLH